MVTLNRPNALNAVNGELSTIVGEAMERAESERDIRVVVLTGSGDRAFCVGAGLKAISRTGRSCSSGACTTAFQLPAT
ncbi:enoyl-CoA hydratase-related protein [Nocardia sp. NPDC052278]|uniref:enoyl-CoA hydratase-related protein n=1 Tax=Nocardia sp. NPDC052278 TaxID=3364328 RepID=UPI0037CC10FD